jgi:hypothetical protein
MARRGYRFIAPAESVSRGSYPRQKELDAITSKDDSKAAPESSTLSTLPSHRLTVRSVGLAVLLALIIGSAIWLSSYKLTNAPSKLSPMKVVRLTSFPGKESEPVLSPDGKMVAFVWDGDKGDNADIYAMLVDSGKPGRLTQTPSRKCLGLVQKEAPSLILFGLAIGLCAAPGGSYRTAKRVLRVDPSVAPRSE